MPQDAPIAVEMAGRVIASRIAEVRPQVNGIIEQRLFTEGTEVREGDVLYQIAAAPYQASVESARAALDRARGAVSAAVNKAERYRTLSNREVASQQDTEAAEAAAVQARADVAAAQASLDAARINLDRTKIRAPINGRIGTSALTVGALVTANQSNALATIQTLDPVFVDVPYSATLVQRMRADIESRTLNAPPEGIQMRLVLDNGAVFGPRGELKFTNATVSESTGTVTLRAAFANPDRMLLPGMFVRGSAVIGIKPGAILVPQRAVARNPRGQAIVLIAAPDDKAEERVVEVTRNLGTAWLIESGLTAGDRVIVDGVQRVRPGTPVSPVPFTDSANGAPASVKP